MRIHPSSAAVTLSLLAALLVPAPAAAQPAQPFINEIHYDNVGTDTGELVEVAGPAGFDLSRVTVVLYNGANGAVYDTDTLTGTLPDEAGTGLGAAALTYPTNGLQNGSPDGIALVVDGVVTEFLSYEGTFTAVGGPADGMTSVDIGVAEGSATPVGQSLQLVGDTAPFTWTGPAAASPGALNAGQLGRDGSGPGEEPPAEPTVTPISAIQGAGTTSPVVGSDVVVEAVVVGDFQDGAAGTQGDLNGFFVQEEDADADGDPATSEGLFVFNGSRPSVDVAIGDLVRVTGRVSEFGGTTQVTAFDSAVEVLASGVALPTAATPTLPFDTLDTPERFEGMRVTFTQPLYVAEYFNLDRFGEMVLTQQASGLVTPTQVTEPGSAAYADLLSFNVRSQITLDDGQTFQNPSPIPFVAPPTSDGAYTDNRRRGDRIDGLTGVVNQAFGAYRIQVSPAEVTTDRFTTTIERPAGPPAVGDGLTVASFNVLNYFVRIGDVCGPSGTQGCRGASNPAELQRQTAKTVTALAALDADVVGLIEIENDGDDAAVRALVEGLNDLLGEGTYDYVPTGFIGTDAIKQAFIYRPDAVTPVGEEAVLDSPEFVNGLASTPKNRPSLAQTFADTAGARVTVSVNHLKSKGSGCGAGDDSTQGAGSCNGTRTRAAELLVDWLAGDPTGGGTDDVLVIGDLNSYAMEDPIDVFVDAGYVNTVLAADADAYGYVFDAQQGTLDYALASPALAGAVTGAAEYGINADEADLIDYNTDFGRSSGYFNGGIPFRASDHDPVLVGLALTPTSADAGGPYTVQVGSQTTLDASGSVDTAGQGLEYLWDLDGDGAFDDATGAVVTYDARGTGPGTRTVSVMVTDAFGTVAVDDAVLDVLARGQGNDGRPPGRYTRG